MSRRSKTTATSAPAPATAQTPATAQNATDARRILAGNVQDSNAVINGMEDALDQVQGNLAALHRLAMMGTMCAMVAHEANNLATPILTLAEDALAGNNMQQMRKALERALTSTQRSTGVMHHLLKLAQSPRLEHEPTSIVEAVCEAVEMAVRPLGKEHIELRLEIPADLSIVASRDLLEQVLLNLILNACRAMVKGGILRVTARRDGDIVEIGVSDTGTGLADAAVQGRINAFLAGQTVWATDWQEIGLGLNVCRTIVQEHGATLELLRNETPGCTARLRWPAN